MRTIITCLLSLGFALPVLAVEVNGVALLEGQNDHSGIRVLFEAQSPSAETDSVFTNTSGDYAIVLSPGVYDAIFSRAVYDSVTIENIGVVVPMTLDTVILEAVLTGEQGPVSGTWGPGDVYVIGDVEVNIGDSLTIVPGTRILFNGPFKFRVFGLLTAIGTHEDSIVITSAESDTGWDGLFLLSEMDTSVLEYCLIEKANSGEYVGGAVSVWGSSPEFRRCRILDNDGLSRGGGFYIRYGSPRIIDCYIGNNTATYGGGIYIGFESSPIIENCVIRTNTADYGGGVFIDYDTDEGRIVNCQLNNNNADFGGGIFSGGNTECRVSDSWILFNTANYNGGGVYLSQSELFIDHTLIYANSAEMGMGGVAILGGQPSLLNCTIVSNNAGEQANVTLANTVAVIRNTIIFGGSPVALYVEYSPDLQFEYSCVYSPSGNAIVYRDTLAQHAPVLFSTNMTTNVNGDSCDTYYNIFFDPQFANIPLQDYDLTEASPCIDAGDPASALDPDGTVADIGAFYYPQGSAADRPQGTAPRSIALYQNYPNPFNAATEIRFDLPVSGAVRLQLFDLNGRLVTTLIDDRLSAGTHISSFNGRALASGVYFYRLALGQYQQTRKMVLLK